MSTYDNNIWYQATVTDAEWANVIAVETEREKAHYEREHAMVEQWGMDHLVASYTSCAKQLAEAKGLTTIEQLADLDGNPVPSRVVNGKYGPVWCVTQTSDYNSPVVAWVNVSSAATVEKQQAAYAKKGYQLVHVTVRAYPWGREAKRVYDLPVVSVERAEYVGAVLA